MKYYLILAVVLSFALNSCINENLEFTDKSSISSNDPNDIELRHPGCCQIEIDVSHEGSTVLCCTYNISIENPNRCPLYLDGPKGTNNSFANGLDGSIQITICSDIVGQPIIFEVPIYWINPKGQIIICETLSLSSECLECPLTYAQGYDVGCDLAGHDDVLCCEQLSECSSAYVNTILDFQEDCPDYVAGVIAGWEACCDISTGGGGGTGGTSKFCGGEPMPVDAESCDCVNEVWVNCIYF